MSQEELNERLKKADEARKRLRRASIELANLGKNLLRDRDAQKKASGRLI